MICQNPKCTEKVPPSKGKKLYCTDKCRKSFYKNKRNQKVKRAGKTAIGLVRAYEEIIKEKDVSLFPSLLPAFRNNAEVALLNCADEYPYQESNMGKLDVPGDKEKQQFHILIGRVEREMKKRNIQF